MADTLSKEQRSWAMSRVRSTDTKPECIVRSLLFRLGCRFTVRARANRELPGKPDVLLRKHLCALFVHGCFWHVHENCPNSRFPKNNAARWRAKLERNAARDRKNEAALQAMGWEVLIVWECETQTTEALQRLTEKLTRRFSPDAAHGLRVAEDTSRAYRVRRPRLIKPSIERP